MKGQSYAANDPIFDQFTRLSGKGRGTVYILDQKTHNLVSAITITEVKDLTPTLRTKFQHIFSYFTSNMGFHPSTANNHAMITGLMMGIGWRASMEQGQAFRTYVPFTSVNSTIWFNHTEGGKEVHWMFAESFWDQALRLYENQQIELYNYSVPALGVDFASNPDSEQDHPYVYCSNLAYT